VASCTNHIISMLVADQQFKFRFTA